MQYYYWNELEDIVSIGKLGKWTRHKDIQIIKITHEYMYNMSTSNGDTFLCAPEFDGRIPSNPD